MTPTELEQMVEDLNSAIQPYHPKALIGADETFDTSQELFDRVNIALDNTVSLASRMKRFLRQHGQPIRQFKVR